MKRQTIAVDIDDVLAANAEGFVRFSNKRWGTHLEPDDYTEHWAEMWQVDFDEVMKRRRAIFEAKVHATHKSFEEARPALQKLSQGYKMVIVSSRTKEIHKDSIDWINNEFPGIFSEIHFVKIYDDIEKAGADKAWDRLNETKEELCQQVGADFLIDDQPKHCVAVAKAGIKALLFGTYRWTKVDNLPKGVTKVKNWQEVLEYFDEKSR